MSGRSFIVLGTASQAPTRHRHHNSYVLRWDDRLVLFDPGEGTQRQCILAGVAIAKLDAVCLTHFHGDHCLGLPGVIQRRALDNRPTATDLGPLPVLYPAEGQPYFDRLRAASAFHDTSDVVPHPLDDDTTVFELGPTASISVRRLDHRIATFGYRVDEPDGVRFDRDELAARGVEGPDISRLLAEGRIDTARGPVELGDVSAVRPGQSMAFVMDTRPCRGATELAAGVDLLVCESTFLDRDRDLANRFGHMTALEAGELAREAGARRLVLTHFSARYPDNEVFAAEAGTVHHDVVAATDLATVAVPGR